MIPEVEHREYDPTFEEDDFAGMLEEGYPHRLPKVYLEGWKNPYEDLDAGEDAVIVVRDKHIVKYTKLEHVELLAETEAGELIWVDGRVDYHEDGFKGHILDDIRTAREYMVEEYDIEASKKRKYKVVFDEEAEMNSVDYYLLSHSVDGEILGNHFKINNGVLSTCFSKDVNLVIPEGVIEIAKDSFRLCGYFDSIVIPSTVTKIACGFGHTKHLEISEDNPKYYIKDGCLIDRKMRYFQFSQRYHHQE